MTGLYKLFILVLLGALAAFGPIVTDMYLPALPSMTGYFSASASMVQLGLTASLVGLALGQLIIGPLSDKYGRRRPLLISLCVFIVSTIACLFSPSIEFFTAARLLQGMAGAGGIVLSKSVTTDLFSGNELTKTFALISAVHGLAPAIAPVLGGVVLNFYDWKGVFWVLFIVGIILCVMSLFLKESLKPEARVTAHSLETFRQFGPVLRNETFRSYALLQGVSFGILFGYIASSTFIFQKIFGLSPLHFSLCFALNAVALGLGNLGPALLKKPQIGLTVGVVGTSVMSVAVAIILYCGLNVFVLEISFFMMLVFLGLVLPTSTALAMDTERKHAGTASAVLGAVAFMVGGIVSPLVCLGRVEHSAGIVFVVSAVGMLIFLLRVRAATKKSAKMEPAS